MQHAIHIDTHGFTPLAAALSAMNITIAAIFEDNVCCFWRRVCSLDWMTDKKCAFSVPISLVTILLKRGWRTSIQLCH